MKNKNLDEKRENMLHIKKLEDGAELFKALGSDIRIHILRLLLDNQTMSMNEIAQSIGVSNGALTSHVKKLEETGLIKTDTVHGSHGNQKMCSINIDQILIDIDGEENEKTDQVFSEEIPVGHFSDYEVFPTCGLSTTESVIGEVDDSRYFAHPDRMKAGILWFGKGRVAYLIPNLLPTNTKIDQITLSFEISSEAPGVCDNWPSDITFRLNGINIGKWTCPGDFGDVRGIFTPDWWFDNWNQYGLLKVLSINKKGTYIDGLRISDVNVKQLNLDYKSTLKFEFAVDEDSANMGGLTIYGAGFGNYNQGIKVQLTYSPM